MADQVVPAFIPNWIKGKETPAANGLWLDKFNPHSGKVLCQIARSGHIDVEEAVGAAKSAQLSWAAVPPVERGMLLLKIVRELEKNHEEMARIVSQETGKSFKDAFGETRGAIQLGLYFASEGQRLHGYTTTSSTANKFAYTIRQPIGVAGLISAANTPIANIAWKVFPALICGNSVVFKSSEDSPATSWFFAQLAHAAGVPAGLVNVLQGLGDEAGSPLIEHPDIKVISFTGSTVVGRHIQETAGKRLIKISLELGGKNALLVCDDADLERAVTWSLLSAFSNAGQRCAAGSRIVVFDAVYETFKKELVSRAEKLKVGMSDSDDFGPVINQEQLNFILATIRRAEMNGARLLTGGFRLEDQAHAGGYYMAPTILENISPDDDLSTSELFGPVTSLYRVRDFEEALALVNSSAYGLTASIHTSSMHRMMEFINRVETGVAVVNAGTYGSEPHMPFGGLKDSGNGTREPGREAVDIYSNWKTVYIIHDPKSI